MVTWKKTLYISWSIIFLHTAGTAMFMPFLPLYVRELGITDPRAQSIWSGVLYGVTALFGGFCSPLWGSIGDRYGRKPLILRTTFGVSLIAFLMSFAANVHQLLVLRIFHGICSGMIPTFIALVSISLPEDKIGQGLGTLQSSQYSGQIIGPFIGGLLTDWIGMRKVLLVISLFTFIAGLATTRFITEPRRHPMKSRSSVVNNLKLVISSRNLRMVAIVFFAIQISLSIVQPILPLFVTSLQEKGHSLTMVGLIYSVTGFATLLFTPFWGKIGDSRGHDTILSRSSLWAGIAFFPQALVTAAYQLLPLRALYGFFLAGILPSTQAMIVKNTEDAQRGGVLGITHALQSCGHAIGPMIGGVLAASIGFRGPFLLTSLLLVAIARYVRESLKNERFVPNR